MVAAYIQSVAEAALRQGEFLLRDWLPGGALHGDEYDVRNPRRADDDCIGNFRINLNGPWADFADGSERARGGDWVSLYAYLRNMTQLGAAREVARQIGHADFKGNGKDHGHNGAVADLSGLMAKKDGGREKNDKLTWTPIVPVPDDAPPPPKAIERFRSYPAATWTYRTADGKVAQHLHRYDPPGERKQFIPLTYCESDQPGRSPAWRQKGLGDNRPLYNLNLIVSSPAAELIVCEGEKASDAAAKLAPECVATTSLNGAQSPGKTDWTPVAGRVVFVVPDHDEPGAGYAKKVADLAMKAGAAKVRIAAWPAGTPEGYDAADALASGWTVEDFAKLLAEARLVEVEQPDQRQGEKDDLDSLIHSQSDLNRTEAFTVRSALAAIGKDDRLDGSKLSAARTIGYGLADSYKSANAPLGLALTQEWDARTGGNAAEWYGQADPDFEAKGNPVTLDSVYKLARQRGWKPEDGTPALPGVRVDPDFVSLAEFIGIPSPPDWIIKGWLTGQSIAVAFGDSAAGKSFFAIDLACCVAAGIPWHGYATKLSPVLYCAGEGHTGLRRRFAAWSLANGIEVSHDEVIAQNFSINRRSFALDEGGAAAVIEEIKAMAERLGEGVRLIVIDTLATMFVGDENSTKDMNAFIQQLKVFVEKYGATILIVHHTGHGDKTRARGAYSLKGAVDIEFQVCKEGETRTIKSTKVKDGKDIPLTNFRLQEIELPESWRDPDDPDETVTSCVFALDGAAEQKESASVEKKRKLSGPQEIAIRALHDAIVESGQHDPKGTLGAHLAAWRKIAYSRGISGGDTQDAKKKAFERARADLMKRNEVVCLDDIYHFVDVGKQASASLLFNKKNPYSNFNDNNETIGTSGTDRDKSGHVSICLDGLPSDRDREIGTDRDTTL